MPVHPFRLVAASHVVAVLALLFVLAPPATAHTELVSTNPETGAKLPSPPSEVSLTFTDQMSGKFNTLSLIILDEEPLALEAVTDANVVRASIPTEKLRDLGLEDAVAWKLVYRVVSADGHPVAGEVDFEAPLPTQAATSGRPSAASETAAPSEPPSEVRDGPEASRQPANTGSDDQSDDSSSATPFVVIAAVVTVASVVFIIFAARRRAQDRASADV